MNTPAPAADGAATDSDTATTSPAGTGKIDVYEILQHNRAAEQQAELHPVVPKVMHSRRKRDFWLLLVISETLLGVIAGLGRQNVVVLVFAGSGMVLLAIGLSWIMWVLMDDY